MTDREYLVPVAMGAKLIGRSARTVRRWISSGQVPMDWRGLVELDDLERVRDENRQRMTRQTLPDEWVKTALVQGESSVTFTVSRLVEALADKAPDADWSTLRICGEPGGRFGASVRLDRLDTRTG